MKRRAVSPLNRPLLDRRHIELRLLLDMLIFQVINFIRFKGRKSTHLFWSCISISARLIQGRVRSFSIRISNRGGSLPLKVHLCVPFSLSRDLVGSVLQTTQLTVYLGPKYRSSLHLRADVGRRIGERKGSRSIYRTGRGGI